mgnify:CR=1 FL=1
MAPTLIATELRYHSGRGNRCLFGVPIHPLVARLPSRSRVAPLLGGVCVVLCTLVAVPSRAAPQGPRLAEPDRDAVVPPKLLEQVALRYPDEAVEDGLHGDVTVLVDVDEMGRVARVRIGKGPHVFHEAALEAARKLRFEPANRGGQTIPATTRILFHFAPAHEDRDHAEGSPLAVDVHADDPGLPDLRPRTTLDEQALEEGAGDGLAEAIEGVAGVTIAGGTTEAGKPIIRGQAERRLLVLVDGVRHESQKWGPDHATEVDPLSAGEITVIRGAAGARYGPDAIGGVILVAAPPMRVESGVGGRAVVSYASNGRRPTAALRLDAAPEALPGVSIRVHGNLSSGGPLTTPDYVLGNTASLVGNVGGSVQWSGERSSVLVRARHHDFRAGIFYGVRSETPDGFSQQLESGRPIGAENWTRSRSIDRPMQDVIHQQVLTRVTSGGRLGTVEATYAFQRNLRREFDRIRNPARVQTGTGQSRADLLPFVVEVHDREGQPVFRRPALDEPWVRDPAAVLVVVDHHVHDDEAIVREPTVLGLGVASDRSTRRTPPRRKVHEDHVAPELVQLYLFAVLIHERVVLEAVADPPALGSTRGGVTGQVRPFPARGPDVGHAGSCNFHAELGHPTSGPFPRRLASPIRERTSQRCE